MLTNNEIVEPLIPIVKELLNKTLSIKKISIEHKDEFNQIVITTMLFMDNKKLNQLYDSHQINLYILGIINNNLNKNRSDYHKFLCDGTDSKYTTLFRDDTDNFIDDSQSTKELEYTKLLEDIKEYIKSRKKDSVYYIIFEYTYIYKIKQKDIIKYLNVSRMYLHRKLSEIRFLIHKKFKDRFLDINDIY